MKASLSFCELCGGPGAGRCKSCDRLVCSVHSGEGGLCVVCLDAQCSICRTSLSVGRCVACLRLVCVECSIQLDPVRRICKECWVRGYVRSRVEVGFDKMARAAFRVLGL